MKRIVQTHEAALLHHTLLMPVPPACNGQLQHHNINALRQKKPSFVQTEVHVRYSRHARYGFRQCPL
ncbi:hypothetical protein [uncultured Chitinophaga sp.]|uniref:hypothetical protein n=1 Tax=uncultured Chitinophaga sp. TaxID=339340 RepID=UPI0025F1A29C|nr:hypothetical protein [uncultured Chitinophaga sp.]